MQGPGGYIRKFLPEIIKGCGAYDGLAIRSILSRITKSDKWIPFRGNVSSIYIISVFMEYLWTRIIYLYILLSSSLSQNILTKYIYAFPYRKSALFLRNIRVVAGIKRVWIIASFLKRMKYTFYNSSHVASRWARERRRASRDVNSV